MRIRINGTTEETSEGLSVSDLLAAKKVQPDRVVVERNGEIVKRDQFAVALLAPGDTIEIVCFVGGG